MFPYEDDTRFVGVWSRAVVLLGNPFLALIPYPFSRGEKGSQQEKAHFRIAALPEGLDGEGSVEVEVVDRADNRPESPRDEVAEDEAEEEGEQPAIERHAAVA